MSMFMPENPQQSVPGATSSVTPASAETTSEDVALMQRVFAAAARNPNLIPSDFLPYVMDWLQTQRMIIPIGQVFGYQRIATQVVTDLTTIPNPVNGQLAVLKVGASAPFTYVPMTYDLEAAHWVSDEFSFAASVETSNLGSPQTQSYASAMSWSPVHLGGLTMQLRWAGEIVNNSGNPACVAHAGVNLVWAQLAGGGFTSATVMDASYAGGGVNTNTSTAIGVDWTSITDPGNYDVVIGGMYAYVSVTGGGNSSTITGGCVGRFIK